MQASLSSICRETDWTLTKVVLDVLLFDGTRGLVSNQLSKSVYSHRAGLLKLNHQSLQKMK